jgi:hypothetical protein
LLAKQGGALPVGGEDGDQPPLVTHGWHAEGRHPAVRRRARGRLAGGVPP